MNKQKSKTNNSNVVRVIKNKALKRPRDVSMSHIYRHERSMGWQVRFTGARLRTGNGVSRELSASFADCKYGDSPVQSLQAAIDFRTAASKLVGK